MPVARGGRTAAERWCRLAIRDIVAWLAAADATVGELAEPYDVIELPTKPSVAAEPVAAWAYHADALQALLDDPDQAGVQFSHARVGGLPVADVIDRFHTVDIFMSRCPRTLPLRPD